VETATRLTAQDLVTMIRGVLVSINQYCSVVVRMGPAEQESGKPSTFE